MGYKIPTVLNNFNAYGSGHKYVGLTSEVALPSFEYLTETIDGAGRRFLRFPGNGNVLPEYRP